MSYANPAPPEAPAVPSRDVVGLETCALPPNHRIQRSRRFGPLEIFPERIVRFPAGLLGFEELTEYLHVAPEALEPLTFLVALEDPEVAFPVLPANLCLSDYAPPLPSEALALIGLNPDEEPEVLVICSLAPDTGTLHANLQGPLVINCAMRVGCQVVLHDSQYNLRHLLGAG
jgi:flagellar assembly factor FliW